MVSYSPDKFVSALSAEGGLPAPPISQLGMVKPSEEGDNESILFAPGTQCSDWISVPTSMIDNVEHVGKIPCVDHEHPLVILTIKAPETDEGRVLTDLVRAMTSSAPDTPQPPAGAAMGAVPGIASLPGIGADTWLGNTVSPAASDFASRGSLGVPGLGVPATPDTERWGHLGCLVANPMWYGQLLLAVQAAKHAGWLSKGQCYNLANNSTQLLDFLQIQGGLTVTVAKQIVNALIGVCARSACDSAFG